MGSSRIQTFSPTKLAIVIANFLKSLSNYYYLTLTGLAEIPSTDSKRTYIEDCIAGNFKTFGIFNYHAVFSSVNISVVEQEWELSIAFI